MFNRANATPRQIAINQAAFEAALNGIPCEFDGIDMKAPVGEWPEGEWEAFNWGKAFGERKAYNIKMGWDV
jgi:hypothetical protein